MERAGGYKLNFYKMNKRTIRDISLENKAVLLRVDYNVPLKKTNKGMVVGDKTRIDLSIDTIKFILKAKPKRLVIFSHLGDPGGQFNQGLSTKPVGDYLAEKLSKKIYFSTDFIEPQEKDRIRAMEDGELIMLENVRFFKGEELNQASFANKIASLGEVFVNDAFGSCHRAHASVVGVAKDMPVVAGLLLDKEIKMIGEAMSSPKKPLVVVLGGAKATTKIPVIERLMSAADYVLLGGGVANTFLKAFGYGVGRSIYSKEVLRISQNLIWRATRTNTKLFLPSDLVVGELASGYVGGVVKKEEIPTQWQALDIGPETRKEYAKIIAQAGTIIWNGPVGACEKKEFAQGTWAVYRAIVENSGAVSVVGGGDTLASLNNRKDQDKISHISTGGGAMLEFIEKGNLPGIEIIEDK